MKNMAILKINNSDLDNARLSNILTPIDTKLKNFDFSNTVVNKPWGHEYLLYSNDNTAIWIMYIKKDFGNSMHCHIEKKTVLILLSGEAVFSTLQGGHIIKESDAVIIDKKTFHSTQAISNEGIFVMEIETPVNKVDLLRLFDTYGRETKGYESGNEISSNINHYNAVFLDKKELNVAKNVGNMCLCLKGFSEDTALIEYIRKGSQFASVVIEGAVSNDLSGELIMPGELISTEHYQEKKIRISKKPLVLLSISRN